MENQTIHVGSRKRLIPNEISFLKSDTNYTKIHLVNGTQLLSSTTLGIIESRLTGFRFMRVHRGTLVNLEHIKGYQDFDTYGQISLENEETILVSRRRNKSLKNLNIMKKIALTLFFVQSLIGSFAQQAVTIDPNGTEAIKFKNSISEKITFWEHNVLAKFGIGIANSQMQFYLPTVTDNIVFGRGAQSSFTELLRINGVGNVGIGVSTPNAPLQFNNNILNRKIVMYDVFNNNHQFYGFGVNGGVMRYQVDILSADHVFYAAVNSTSSNELFRIKGTGNVTIAGKIENEAFQAPTLVNGWTIYQASPQVYKDKEGRVHLKGSINNGTTITNTVLFTLPLGYRPMAGESLIYQVANAGPSGYTTGHIKINGATGEVSILSTGMQNFYLGLDGISFRAE